MRGSLKYPKNGVFSLFLDKIRKRQEVLYGEKKDEAAKRDW